MKNGFSSAAALALFAASPALIAASLSSTGYQIQPSVIDAGGGGAASANFQLREALAQPAPAGTSVSANYRLEAGALAGTPTVQPLSPYVVADIQAGIAELLNDPTLSTADSRDLIKVVNRLDRVVAALDSGDLVLALNHIRQSIQTLERLGESTEPLRNSLARSAELMVTVEINVIAASAGDTHPQILLARSLIEAGATQLLAGDYRQAVAEFRNAYAEALAV